MTGKFREFEGELVRIILMNGDIIEGFAILCIAAEDDSDGVEYDSIQLAKKENQRSIYFDDEIKSVEIIEP